MISFNYETNFELNQEDEISAWITQTLADEDHNEGEINYIFCDDEYLHKLNVEFLNHDTLTDIISFDYTMGKLVSGDIYISVERVRDNAKDFNTDFNTELQRVMVHGILHYCGYKDKSDADAQQMRTKENFYINKIANIQ